MSDTEIRQTIVVEEQESFFEEQYDAAIEAELAPIEELTGPVDMRVQSRNSANSTVATRWGDVEFDKEGLATLTLPAEDIPLLDQLQWLLPSDRAKFLGKAIRTASPEEEGFKSARSKLAELQTQHSDMVSSATAEIDRLNEENTSLREELNSARAQVTTLGKDVSELRASATALAAASAASATEAAAKAAKAKKNKRKS